jgi:tetratricopeptide (TPR) repeat protein
MFARTTALLSLAAVTGLMTACGPSIRETVREDARGRVDHFNAQVTYQQAEQSFKVGRFERALRDIDATIAVYPDEPKFHVLKGRIHLETHHLENAIESFEKAIELDEDNARAHYFAGVVHQRWSNYEAALESYTTASEADTANVGYVLAAAESLIALDRLDEARGLVEPKLDFFEHNAAIHHLLGQISLLQKQYEDAVNHYTEARLLNPEDLQLLEELARVQFEAGDYGQCFESLGMLQIESETELAVELRLLEARCLALMARGIEARNLYMELSSSNPSDVNVWIELGTIAWELGDFHRVAQSAARATALAPHRYEGWMLKAINERHKGNTDEIVPLFQKAVEAAPDAAMPRILLGMALEEQGDLNGAAAAYRDAIRVEPGHKEAAVLSHRVSTLQQVTSVPTNQ